MSVYTRLRPLVSNLQTDRLQLYLDTLADHSHQPGGILEVGCFKGATTVEACLLLRRLGRPRPYTIVDTFAGFVPDQFEQDTQLGTPGRLRSHFSGSSRRIVERTMRYHGLGEVRVVEGDICKLDVNRLPSEVSVCLLDVDLAVPTYDGLSKVWPRTLSGGVILVDDCDDDTDWRGARVGYQEFCRDHGLAESYKAGFGLIRA